MDQKDYLCKEIDDLGEFLTILIGILTNSKLHKVDDIQIDRAEKKILNLGLDINGLTELNSDEFFDELINRLNISDKNLLLLGEIYFTKGKLLQTINHLEK